MKVIFASLVAAVLATEAVKPKLRHHWVRVADQREEQMESQKLQAATTKKFSDVASELRSASNGMQDDIDSTYDEMMKSQK